ncbi:MAG: 30S ribosomal protein S7 [Omnitrophica bacterium RIFCSPLOWO2_12_FULL_50_11]|nr:MAG: 30S ribosomal protein S7 [Omnitrophica bacterium RIFCSPLOWO2_12_FULL_50_11]
MRRHRATKRKTPLDPKYKNVLVTKLVNIVMQEGKKSLAERLIYKAFGIVQEKTGKEAIEVFKQSVENVRPLLETKSRRVGGATYQVPLSVRPERGQILAMRWMRDFARRRHGAPMEEKLASEILEAYKKSGSAMKKREDVHKMAESNRAFAHYRW